jgi:hypothetical protein
MAKKKKKKKKKKEKEKENNGSKAGTVLLSVAVSRPEKN